MRMAPDTYNPEMPISKQVMNATIQPAISFDQCLELFKEMKNAPIGAHVATEEYRSLLKALYQRMEMDVQMVSYEGREG